MVGLSRVVTVTFTGAGGGLAHDHMTLGQVEVLGDSLAAGLLAQRGTSTHTAVPLNPSSNGSRRRAEEAEASSSSADDDHGDGGGGGDEAAVSASVSVASASASTTSRRGRAAAEAAATEALAQRLLRVP